MLKILSLSVAIIVTCGIVLLPQALDKDSYLDTTIDKQNLLAKTNGPKVILVGGSNLAFGWDSSTTEEKLGMPVVNMGLHAGIGLEFMFEEVKPFIQTGDLILVMPEYEHFYDQAMHGDTCVWRVLFGDPSAFRNIKSFEQYLALVKHFRSFLGESFKKIAVLFVSKCGLREFPPTVYHRSSFNWNGDVTAHLCLSNCWDGKFPKIQSSNLNEKAFSSIENFSKFCAERDSCVMVIWPSVPESFYNDRKEWIERVTTFLAQRSDVTVMGIPSDYVLPAGCFFDTYYHLNALGRSKRTNAVISRLLNFGTSL